MSTEQFSAISPRATDGIIAPEETYGKVDRTNTTDVVHQPVKLYIEGVEVPWESISITQAIGILPTCEVQIPPHPGLMDIIRYYAPKVHVFYTDIDSKVDKLLFWGHLTSSHFSKNRTGGGSSNIQFRCSHKNQLAKDLILYFGNFSTNETATANAPPGTASVGSFGSEQSIIDALRGITGVNTTGDKNDLRTTNSKEVIAQADTSKLDADLWEFEDRLTGMPAIIINLWNQLKKTALLDPKKNLHVLALYMPLFQEGLSYFRRLSGHYLVEKEQQSSKQKICPNGKNPSEIMVAHSARTGASDAYQTQLTVQMINNAIGFTGEMGGFIEFCEQFYASIEYEMITLASPAEVNLDPTAPDLFNPAKLCAVETIVKPIIPFYYSPICNVILPKMFYAIDVAQDESEIPTRVHAYHSAIAGSTSRITTNFRGPNTIREAVSLGSFISGDGKNNSRYELTETMGNDFNVPGKYEQGRGVKPKKVMLPWWLSQIIADKDQQGNGPANQTFPEKGSPQYDYFLLMMKAWQDQHGYDIDYNYAEPDRGTLKRKRNELKDGLNPFGLDAKVAPHQKLMFAGVDYEFAKIVAQSRQGSVSCPFNPYIIPGYPMDVIDDSPVNPSFHGLCTSVTHTFTSRSIGTTVGMAAVMTYAELSNYHTPPLAPWLQLTLGIINGTKVEAEGSDQYGSTAGITDVRSTILQNPEARAKANDFYFSVLGVGAADPMDMYDFGTGQAIPQFRDAYTGNLTGNAKGNTKLPMSNGGDGNDWSTTMGNLRLVKRAIESKDSISEKFGYTFIDFTPENYLSSSSIQYSNPNLGSDFLLEHGASLFLDYLETEDFIDPSFTLPEAPTG